MFSSPRLAAPAAWVLMALALQGCAFATVTPPVVEVENVQLAALGIPDQGLVVTLCVTNPNSRRLAFRTASFHVRVNGSPFADGSSLSAIDLPPGSATIVPLSVGTTVVNLGAQLLTTLATGQVDYTIVGSVGLDGLPFSVTFRRAGSLSVLRTGLGLLQAADTPATTNCGPLPGLPPQA